MNLDTEFAAASRELPPDLERVETTLLKSCVRRCRATFEEATGFRPRVYQPHEHGVDALVVAVRVAFDTPHCIDHPFPSVVCRTGDIIDLVAWPVGKPREFALRTGSATYLGCAAPQFMGTAPDPKDAAGYSHPTEIHRTPLDWLLSNGNGICLLAHERRVQQALLLQLCGGWIVGDPVFGRSIRDIGETPPAIPPIFIRRKASEELAA